MNTLYVRYLSTAVLLTCVSLGAQAQTVDPKFDAMLASGFKAQGIAGLDRLQQDPIQALCSDPEVRNTPAAQKVLIEEQSKAMAAIKPPADGKYLGSWKAGEAVAQSGRGATWSDTTKTPNGGGCYNCHQISKQEISYGNIGPSLTGYGKARGTSEAILTYTWNRINNSKAYNACSNMPRMAHFNLLTEQQIKDVMALLLDPESPVNK
ncbi:MAG: sulfur oxidation c-type cytochrome SoxX [Zwartia sp.]|jgi:sulfur-oxidizing protein SoxX